jgi:salicylate hydroxylase
MNAQNHPVLVAGAGVAGLTAALAFATRGFPVRMFEQAPRLETVGAGLQLSPNATHILQRLGVLESLRQRAVRPEAVVLKSAASLKELARVPLGAAAEKRWHAPYLVAHRADLQRSLLERVEAHPAIELALDAKVSGVGTDGQGVSLSVTTGGETRQVPGWLLVGADGVWSTVRKAAGFKAGSRFSGELAWRTTVPLTKTFGASFGALGAPDCVTAFLHAGFHMIAYPVSGGEALNLVAFTKGERIAEGWSGNADPEILARATRGTAPALERLIAGAGSWLAWPLHTVDQEPSWIARGRVALIGDAAHAMTPFAAQGAAMAIEDADTLAHFAGASPATDPAAALAAWERSRKPRVAKVARRGALNHLAWHAAGPVALARDLFLKLRSPASLAADLDWLYGWRAPEDGKR